MQYTLTVEFRFFTNPDGPSQTELNAEVNRVLHDGDNGRHPFEVEQVQHGMEAIVRRSIERLTDRPTGRVWVYCPSWELKTTNPES